MLFRVHKKSNVFRSWNFLFFCKIFFIFFSFYFNVYTRWKLVSCHVLFFRRRYEQRHGSVPSSARETRAKKTPPSHLQQVVAQRAIQTIQESIYVIELFISQMYICMPLPTSATKATGPTSERDTLDMAVLVSLDRTKVRAVLAESIIVSGTFDLFRLCFTEDRGPHYDYTGRQDDFTNYCFVPKGYLEVTWSYLPLTNGLIDWLIDLVIDRWVHLFNDWLIDWFVYFVIFKIQKFKNLKNKK